MIKLVWAVLCEKVITDQQTGQTSFVNCIETIGATKFPVVLQAFSLGTRWHFDTESEFIGKLRLILFCPDKSERLIMTSDVHTGRANNHRILFALNGIRLDKPGHYVLGLQRKSDHGWTSAQEIPFDAALVTLEGKTKTLKKRTRTAPDKIRREYPCAGS